MGAYSGPAVPPDDETPTHRVPADTRRAIVVMRPVGSVRGEARPGRDRQGGRQPAPRRRPRRSGPSRHALVHGRDHRLGRCPPPARRRPRDPHRCPCSLTGRSVDGTLPLCRPGRRDDRPLTSIRVRSNVLEEGVMNRSKPGRAERNAGAFLGHDLLVPAPIRTLSDDYSDEPTEPEDSDRVPEPEPPGVVRRLSRQIGATSGRASRRPAASNGRPSPKPPVPRDRRPGHRAGGERWRELPGRSGEHLGCYHGRPPWNPMRHAGLRSGAPRSDPRARAMSDFVGAPGPLNNPDAELRAARRMLETCLSFGSCGCSLSSCCWQSPCSWSPRFSWALPRHTLGQPETPIHRDLDTPWHDA